MLEPVHRKKFQIQKETERDLKAVNSVKIAEGVFHGDCIYHLHAQYQKLGITRLFFSNKISLHIICERMGT